MPQLRREMSWLSPKRRKTTGNLRTDVNGKTSDETTRASVNSALSRTISQPIIGDGAAEGDLFYACLRKVKSDSTSSHLLTFASASVANEWWMLLQLHFPKTSRPEAQQFVLHGEDSVAEIWKHSSFAHLQSKWMYISLPNVEDGRVGGAPQKMMFAQDILAEVLNIRPRSEGDLFTDSGAKGREIKGQSAHKNEGKLEQYLQDMTEALQQNTQKAAELSAKIQQPGRSDDGKRKEGNSRAGPLDGGNVFDMSALTTPLDQLTQSLQHNSQAIEALTKRHYEDDQTLRATISSLSARQKDDRVDMQRLYTHVDYIQSMMEEIVKERRDSARVVSQQDIDLSPLTSQVEKMQESVQYNSELMKELIATLKDRNDKEEPATVDVSPLTRSLERIHGAIEQQSEHTKALVGFASSNGDETESSAVFADRNLAPLGEHLEQIYNAIEEGNRHAIESQPSMDVQTLRQDLEGLYEQAKQTNAHVQRLVEVHEGLQESLAATRGGNGELEPLLEHLVAIKDTTMASNEASHRFLEQQSREDRFDISPLTSRLDDIHALMEAQHQVNGNLQRDDLDNPSWTALTTHLQTLTSLTEQTSTSTRKQTSSLSKMQNAVSETSTQIRQLVERNKEQDARIEAQSSQMREMMSGQRELVEVVRQLSKSLAAQNREACGHVVVPPPRKMNRKLVGFVYDAKDGGG